MELNSKKLKYVVSMREDVINFCRNSLSLSAEYFHLKKQPEYTDVLSLSFKQQPELLVLDASVFFDEKEAAVFLTANSEILEHTVAVVPLDSNPDVVRKLRENGLKTVYFPCEEEFAETCFSAVSGAALKTRNKGTAFYRFYPGSSAEAERIRQEIEEVSRLDVNVLFLGETGTGKTYLAEIIHRHSLRKNMKFVRVNMPSLVDSLAESQLFGTVSGAYTGAVSAKGFLHEADGGTVFLDEITEIKKEMQAKLLKVLDSNTFYRIGSSSEQKVDVRYISASNGDISSLVDSGTFRKDLFYRIGERVIELPPLRNRAEDIPEIASSILKEFSMKNVSFDETALEFLQDYTWPGNTRQLKSCIKQLANDKDRNVINADELKMLVRNYR